MNISIRKETQDSLQRKGITEYTDIQKQVLPHALNHEDILAQAPTGSGKTLAYLIPVLENLEPQGKGKHYPRALVLAPTRELCTQIASVGRDLLSNREGIRTGLLTGGYDMNAQIRSFKKGADIVIGTPARVMDHLRRHTFKPQECQILVLDEADEMLSMGFREDVEQIITQLPEHQTFLMSATFGDEVRDLAEKNLKHPFACHMKQETVLKQDISVHALIIKEQSKPDALEKILKKTDNQVILFANTRKTCDFLQKLFHKKGYSIETIHSEMDYGIRKKIMQDFRSGSVQILCATDVAARGIDIPSVGTVILYDLPDTEESLIHRVGRTARAGQKGTAWILEKPSEKERYPLKRLFPQIHMDYEHDRSAFRPRRRRKGSRQR